MSAAHTVISPSIPENGSKIVEYFVIGPARDLSHDCLSSYLFRRGGRGVPARPGRGGHQLLRPPGPAPRQVVWLFVYLLWATCWHDAGPGRVSGADTTWTTSLQTRRSGMTCSPSNIQHIMIPTLMCNKRSDTWLKQGKKRRSFIYNRSPIYLAVLQRYKFQPNMCNQFPLNMSIY